MARRQHHRHNQWIGEGVRGGGSTQTAAEGKTEAQLTIAGQASLFQQAEHAVPALHGPIQFLTTNEALHFRIPRLHLGQLQLLRLLAQPNQPAAVIGHRRDPLRAQHSALLIPSTLQSHIEYPQCHIMQYQVYVAFSLISVPIPAPKIPLMVNMPVFVQSCVSSPQYFSK